MIRLSTIRQVIGLAGWLLLSFAAAGVGAVASVSAGIFYQQLLRPEWAPPAWVFGPLWSVLYLLMGIAAWLVWRQRGFRESGMTLWLFIAQLTANALWSWLFFSWHNGAWAFYEILILWVLLLCTVATFWRVRSLAGALLLPYLAWVTFAIALCFAIWKLNPVALGG
ncbi:MAG TPA: TspO/MBR family protein [Bradyrhizobium sp.]|nr:TspO/MBR family protein [Bradyrhizobium sp.]